MKPAKFKYVRAETVEHAVELLGSADPVRESLLEGKA
jgi:CO/xanthine dehydrogenase FAD-binding subunit